MSNDKLLKRFKSQAETAQASLDKFAVDLEYL